MHRFYAKLMTVALAGFSCIQVVGCGYSEEEMQAREARIDELESQLQASNREGQNLQGRLRRMSSENQVLGNKLRQLGVNVEQLESERAQLQARERQAQARLDTFRNMIQRFRAMIASGQLRVRIARNRMVVELPEGILFDSGKADLKDAGKQALAQVASVLKTIPSRDFQIAGHTDNVPIRGRKFPSNWELSTARAVNVARYLVEQGLEAGRLSAAGHADTAPVASNDTDEGRQQNRRIEIVLLPNLDELPDLSSLESMDGATPPPANQPAAPAATPRQ